jgi:hypothetical protein
VKISVNQALQSDQGLKSINSIGRLPVQLSLDIAHNARQINEVKKLYNDNRDDLIKEHGRKDEKTGQYIIDDENMEVFNKEMNDLIQQEVDINVREIKASRFPEDFMIEPFALVDLEWMILEE